MAACTAAQGTDLFLCNPLSPARRAEHGDALGIRHSGKQQGF